MFGRQIDVYKRQVRNSLKLSTHNRLLNLPNTGIFWLGSYFTCIYFMTLIVLQSSLVFRMKILQIPEEVLLCKY